MISRKDGSKRHYIITIFLFQFATKFSNFSLQDNGAAKPFQNLLFLIRNWANEEEFSFGYEGGKNYLEEAVFKIKPNQHENMKELRKIIKDSFETIKCFLMPHPGFIVAGKEAFNGSWGVIDKPFVDHLKVLVPSMLAPENLSVKKIGGEEMTGEKLYWHMQFYLELFQSSKFPTAKSIYDSTVAKFLQDLVSNSAALYKDLMTNGTATVETHSDFDILSLTSKNKSIDFYDNEKKIGDNDTIVSYRNSLISEIEKIQAEQNQTIYLKIENVIKEKALEAQRNETLLELKKAEELKKAQELAELKAKEVLLEMQKKIEIENAKKKEIADLEKKLEEEKKAMEEAKRKKEEELKAIKIQQDFEKKRLMEEAARRDAIIQAQAIQRRQQQYLTPRERRLQRIRAIQEQQRILRQQRIEARQRRIQERQDRIAARQQQRQWNRYYG